ncbi:hypothetical protein PLICRDRAFT_97478 [Plicaturopsis crispa FD-325 SS-3]|nr:hypothetical protein PLICRDRAFT_97478 [Plicaturopsis crispa FD-325 SS-3]
MSLIPPAPPSVADASADATVCSQEHCFYAFDTLYCSLTSADPLPVRFVDDKYPLFVTWSTRSSRPGRAPRLRGCIGNFGAQPIREGIAEYALISAFKDYRFNPIQESELESLECCISLLTDFEDAGTYLDWTIGVHGISIQFPHPSLLPASSGAPSPISSSTFLPTARVTSNKRFSACYLPDVIPEQGWDKIEAVDSAIHKAGWNGRITEDIRRSVSLRRYQSKTCTVGWEEYARWREQNGGSIELH